MKNMNKRDLILDSLEDLLTEEKGASCSVREIAQKAGIAKGGIYYYFQSKEEIFDAHVERTYHSIILQCQELLNQSQDNAIQKLNLLYTYYRTSFVSSQLDEYLHQPQNAYIHQKSLAKILLSLSPIVSQIIKEGIQEGLLHCDFPDEISQIILSIFCFLLDPGIFTWSPLQVQNQLKMLATLIENGLHIPEKSLSFFYQTNF